MFMLSTALTFLGVSGFGLAGALVLDYFGLLGARQDTSPGELVLAAVVSLVGGALFGVGRRLSTRHRAVAPTKASTHGWRPREFLLLVFPVAAVLLAADEIGSRAPGGRAGAWAWFVVMSAIGTIGGGWSGARSSLGELDAATRRLSTMLATYTALIGVVAASFVGGLPRVLVMGVVSGFLLSWVIARAFRALGQGLTRRR
jgi:hypothetical protein